MHPAPARAMPRASSISAFTLLYSGRLLALEIIALEDAHAISVVIRAVAEKFFLQFGLMLESAFFVHVNRRRIRRIDDQVQLAHVQYVECVLDRKARRLARIAAPLALRRDDDLELA